MTQTLLHIDASARTENSVSRALSQQIVHHLNADKVIRRDLAQALPQISEDWIASNFTPADDRDAIQRDVLALSDMLVDEVRQADILVIGSPIYNFSVPASMKAWIDLIARVGQTFNYTPDGPVGLLTGKRAIVALVSGGTQVGSDIDFASGYIRHVLGFIGITDVEFITADQLGADPTTKIEAAHSAVQALAA